MPKLLPLWVVRNFVQENNLSNLNLFLIRPIGKDLPGLRQLSSLVIYGSPGQWFAFLGEDLQQLLRPPPLCWSGFPSSPPVQRWPSRCRPSNLDSFAVSVFVVDVELTNTETAAATPPTVMQIFQRASDQWKVLKWCDSRWISSPMHLNSLLDGLLGVFVHHRRAGEDFSVTFAWFCHHWDNEIWGNQVCICFGLIFGFLWDYKCISWHCVRPDHYTMLH